MNCPYCGGTVVGGAPRCAGCGADLGKARDRQTQENAEHLRGLIDRHRRPRPLHERLGARGLAGVVLLIIIVVVAFVVALMQGKPSWSDREVPWEQPGE
jgi:uncharacterized membrane protein YvbJ